MGCVNMDDGGRIVRTHTVQAFVKANIRFPGAEDEATMKTCGDSLITKNPCLKDSSPDQCYINHLPGLTGRVCLEDPDFEKCMPPVPAAQKQEEVNVQDIAASLLVELNSRLQKQEDEIRAQMRQIESIEDKKERSRLEEENEAGFIKLCGLIVVLELFKASAEVQDLKAMGPVAGRADIVKALLKGENLLVDAERTGIENAISAKKKRISKFNIYLEQLEAQPKNYPLEIAQNRHRIKVLEAEVAGLEETRAALSGLVANEKLSAFRKQFVAAGEKLIARDDGGIMEKIKKGEEFEVLFKLAEKKDTVEFRARLKPLLDKLKGEN
ncbi:MAG: hypothetical protein ABIJ26_03050 [Candidatus Margulisiibacteriota bacterium]|nr:hypothetical protein [Candidatus Margulisiibacteriota bacterium]